MLKNKKNLANVASQMINGVVQIQVEGFIEEDIESIMNPAIKIPGNWLGSGFFVKYKNLEGYIVTNAHVVRNANKIEISSMLTSEERFEAELVGLVKNLDPDVALIKLSNKELQRFKDLAVKDIEYLELWHTSSPVRGEELKAIGYPMGMTEPNMSGGEITNFVSGSEFTTERYVTDAAINLGNSGGPSVVKNGKVVGLNTAVMVGADNIGFITPAGFVKTIIENLIQHNDPHFSGIGGKLQKNANSFNSLLKQSEAKGLIVAKVKKEGFLASAAIQSRDVILSINDIEFDRHGIVIGTKGHYRHKNIYDVMKLIPIGQNVEITYLRDGKIRTTHANAMRDLKKGVKSRPIISDRKYINIFGMVIQELSFEIIDAMSHIDNTIQVELLQAINKEKTTLVVTHIEQATQVDEIEWSLGEMIVSANEKQVHTLDELQAILDKNKGSMVLLECINKKIGYFKN